MDCNKMIDEIVARVAAKLAECEEGQAMDKGPDCDQRPGLLILAQEHGEACHEKLDSARLGESYQMICAKLRDYQVSLDGCEAVILYGLTNEALGKLASGVCDTAYTRLAAQAILSGKRVYVPAEQVELYRYAQTAPAPYYAMLQEKLALLEASGVTICPQNALEDCILEEPAAAPRKAAPCKEAPAAEPAAVKEMQLAKRVITERDVTEASAAKVTCIRIPAKSIVTDLAKDYALARNIRLIRE